ncbi:hypothetical protein CD32_23605 [Lysinibacillus odysseyi 34hs-1 = NBRC 100172]|uniref:Uncharacterized protein n=1 Tax=Lysinibacillus odysseyi 34hs-1 = NBRC 100172 TaxID=1220589 RepID=A0A0A3J5C8_9BACI|nr:hypothetical protein [Lysinibacillus odysseyi]KGR82262.1 hypothetical protein CD32_23605 [Lysinibacillus odysseyi 34hs-1 = NBRC 100172]
MSFGFEVAVVFLVDLPLFLMMPAAAFPPCLMPLTIGPPNILAAEAPRSQASNFLPVNGSFPTVAS